MTPEPVEEQPRKRSKGGAKKRITKTVRIAVDAMVSGRAKNQKEAAEQAGIWPENLSRALQKPHVIEFLERRSRRALALATARAAAVKVELLESPSEHVRNEASSYVLALQGISPVSERSNPTLNVNITPGYVVHLPAPSSQVIEAQPMAVDVARLLPEPK
jgi:hypothetical protein